MKRLLSIVVALLVASAAPTAIAQGFSLGSDGSYGPFDTTSDTTLQLPPDGVIHATMVTVAVGATLLRAK